ncbi:unnamed protein product [Vicia faba]|uniref:Uncharacterized protein n=1 Tax=Vicia faba TaxID=3906 RepID=A0AAV1AQ48_VICFA|nr:unnamed protein product [Vicia faba]
MLGSSPDFNSGKEIHQVAGLQDVNGNLKCCKSKGTSAIPQNRSTQSSNQMKAHGHESIKAYKNLFRTPEFPVWWWRLPTTMKLRSMDDGAGIPEMKKKCIEIEGPIERAQCHPHQMQRGHGYPPKLQLGFGHVFELSSFWQHELFQSIFIFLINNKFFYAHLNLPLLFLEHLGTLAISQFVWFDPMVHGAKLKLSIV